MTSPSGAGDGTEHAEPRPEPYSICFIPGRVSERGRTGVRFGPHETDQRMSRGRSSGTIPTTTPWRRSSVHPPTARNRGDESRRFVILDPLATDCAYYFAVSSELAVRVVVELDRSGGVPAF